MKQNGNGAALAKKLLVISDHNGFSRDLMARWQMQLYLPEFTALSSDLLSSASFDDFDVAIAGDLRTERASEVLAQLNRGKTPGIFVAPRAELARSARQQYARITVVSPHDAWLDTVVLLAQEMFKRAELSTQLDRLQRDLHAHHKRATLGKYMVESRHGFNNALTSVLGNAELLLLESARLSPGMKEQIETLHAMSLRLHEMMQRFTSLELEMECTERSSPGAKAFGAVACPAE